MKKKGKRESFSSGSISKIVMRMKLLTFFVLFSTVTIAANSYSQQTKFRFKLNEVTVRDVFKEIEDNSKFIILYNEKQLDVNRKVSVEADNETVETILNQVFEGIPNAYKIYDRQIVILSPDKKERPANLKVESMIQKKKELTGTVQDVKKLPLPGVTVLVKGTTIGTVTDGLGQYKLSVPDDAKTLVFSFMGMKTQEIALTGKTTVDVEMVEETVSLEEVVAVGYGTLKKSDLTGSVVSVKGKELASLSTQRIDQALQGRAAGVYVLNTDGSPGGNTTIRIRGMNSVNGGNSALIVIDGLQGGVLNSINPNDIESIEILKDASATAIYGAQGANGVVLITTKLGKKGKPVISYGYSYGIQNLRKKLDVMNASDFAETINAFKLTLNGNGANPVPTFSTDQINTYKTNGGTDWQDVIYRTAPIQNHEISMSGATNNLEYLVSGSYLNQQGILVNSGYKRYSLRANLKAEITKWADFGLSWAGSKEAGNSPPFGSGGISFLGNSVNVAPRWDATVPVYDADGKYSVHPLGFGASDTWNPLASAKEPLIDNNTMRNILNGYLEFKPITGLSLKITGGASISNVNNRSYQNLKTFDGVQAKGLGVSTESMYSRYQNSNILTYDRTLSQHHFTLTAVAEQQYMKYNGSTISAKNFLVDQVGVFNLGGASIITPYSDANERKLNSYMGRINYVFADKYLITATYRADGSSVFGKNNKWGYFPSASAAWNAYKESFIQKLNLFSNLKVRASWGVTGNQAINPYQTLAQISSGGNYPYNGSEVTDLGFYISSASNPNLKWESTTQTDFGLDVGLLRGRLTFTGDYYKKTTKDLLLLRTLPGYTGLNTVMDNVGSMENKGLELGIGGDPFIGTFKWNTGFNISGNRSKVLDLGKTNPLTFTTTKGGYGVDKPFMYLKTGEPFGQIYGYGYEGTWKQTEAAKAAAFGQLPGDPKYTDTNKDGKIDINDLKVIGNAFPKYIIGWTNNFSYKNFQLDFLIQGTQGNDIFNQGRIRLEAPGEGTSSNLLNRWTPQNQNTDVPAFTDQRTREQANLMGKILIGNDNRSGRWVEDGSYVRLKNITFSYTFPKSVTDRINLANLKVYVSGTNLITITKYSGYDPEVSSFNGNDAQMGVDFSNYPPAKMFTFGFNVTF